ncbi:Glycosyltransferase involved in cell wall bisynthesis [Paraburkholderia phenazinium]|uniref:Glycosyltransferase involved in cell wall bisynthesis n=2 Tax=Paraburkholderia phenazinium TaxID=60549 RepID=A0A1G8E0U2_9BURK|nr:Glycosyltransferase involved in cell wall bisynthesis [Paraburkholderia phenazinium]
MVMSEHKSDPIVWMNVTTSANWTRPPVGIVRVEQALCEELLKALGPNRFKACVWLDGEFVEWVPSQPDEDVATEKVVDMLLPRTPSFTMARNFIARAIRKFEVDRDKSDEKINGSLDIRIPLSTKNRLKPKAGDVLISVGLDWDQPYTAEFHNLTSQRGIKVITCCYDLIPVLFPQYCVGDVASRFKEYFNSLTWGSSGVLCISEQTKRDYLNLCEQLGAPQRPTCVIPLGDNVPKNIGDVSSQLEQLASEPFILFVSTIERRKNHEVLYRAYHLLSKAGHANKLPKLVFVGMQGWGVGDLLKDVELDPLTQGLIVQLNHVNDAELNLLYTKAAFCVYPSLYEGWGLPVGEALALGKAVLASDQGSLPEVGGEMVRYLSPWDPQGWADAILELVTDPQIVDEMEARASESYSVRTWKETASAVVGFIKTITKEVNSEPIVLYPGYDFSTQVGLHVGDRLRSVGQPGFLMFGPHRPLRAGHYEVSIIATSGKANQGGITLDFVANGGEDCYWSGEVQASQSGVGAESSLASFEVRLDHDIDDFEIRCMVDSAALDLKKVVIERLA